MKTNQIWDRTDIASGFGMSARCRASAPTGMVTEPKCARIAAAAQTGTQGHVGLPTTFPTVPGTRAWSPPGC